MLPGDAAGVKRLRMSLGTPCAIAVTVQVLRQICGMPPALSVALLLVAQLVTILAFRIFSREANASSREAAQYGVVVCLSLFLPDMLPEYCGEYSAGLSIALCCCVGVMMRHRLVLPTEPKKLDRLDGRIVVVTGSSAGIGQETATQLLRLGAKVVFACRTESRARAAMATCCAAAGVTDERRAAFVPLDLCAAASVVECARLVRAEFKRCDALVCNAGGFSTARSTTAEGWETNLGANHLNHLLLAHLLLPLLRRSPSTGRLVFVASSMHKAASAKKLLDDPMFEAGKYAMFDGYTRSKLAQVACARVLQRLEEKRKPLPLERVVVVTATHPGNAATDVTRDFPLPTRTLS